MIWAAIIRALWRPLAWLLGGLGVYAKGRSDASVRAENKGLRATAKAYEVRDEVENRVADELDARDKLRAYWGSR